ncbi:Beta-1 [Mactra antiquata]
MLISNRCLYSCMWIFIVSSATFMSVAIIGNLKYPDANIINGNAKKVVIKKDVTNFIKDVAIDTKYQKPFFPDVEQDNVKDLQRNDLPQSAYDIKKIPKETEVKQDMKEDMKETLVKSDDEITVEEEIRSNQDQVQETLKGMSSSEREYYKMRTERVNPFDYEFLVKGENICEPHDPPYLVLLCLTRFYDIENREAIRKTWGSVATTRSWPLVNSKIPTVKIVFLFGGPVDTKVKQSILEDESARYGDIVMADFVDSYVNLTYKVMMGLKWVNTYCPQAKYIVKVDQDMFLHVINLIRYLEGIDDPDPGIVLGYVNARARVLRSGKWGVNFDLYPPTSYPNYTNGNTYVISGKASVKMLKAAEHMPYVFIEDAFLTGIVRTVVGLKIIDHQGFARWNDPPPRICSFHNPFRIAATNTDDTLKESLWKALKYRNLKNCYDAVKRHRVA